MKTFLFHQILNVISRNDRKTETSDTAHDDDDDDVALMKLRFCFCEQ